MPSLHESEVVPFGRYAARDEAGAGPHRPRVLCVDDEPHVLESLRDSLRRRFDVHGTTNGFEALRMLAEDRFDIVLSDMRMPLLDGTRFLTLAREHAPETVRLLLTGQSRMDDAVAAVNEGEIFRFLIKPCGTRELVDALDAAARRREIVVGERLEREQTLVGTLRALRSVADRLDHAGALRADRVRDRAVALATHAGDVPVSWELERAAELLQLGVIGLAKEIRVTLTLGNRLGREQASELERLPELAAPFLWDIPRLRPVAALLSAAGEPLVPTEPGLAGTPMAARVVRIALDFELMQEQGFAAGAAVGALALRSGRYDERLLASLGELVQAEGR